MPTDLDDDLNEIQRGKVNPELPLIGLAVGVVPFMVSYRSTHQSSVNVTAGGAEITHVTRKTQFDYVAVPCGGIAFAVGVVGMIRGLVVRKYQVMGLGIAAMALGVLQAVRGFLP